MSYPKGIELYGKPAGFERDDGKILCMACASMINDEMAFAVHFIQAHKDKIDEWNAEKFKKDLA
jgi:hypothetical protein